MGLETPVRRTIHTSGGKGTVHAQLSLASLDVVSHLLQIVKALDVVLGIASGGQQLLVVDDAVGLDNVGDSGNGVAILQCEGIAGQLTVQLAAGQVVAVILPVGQTHRAVDLEQGGSLALLHLAHQGGLVLAGSSGNHGHGHAGLLGVDLSQILPSLILLGLEVQVVDLAVCLCSGAGSSGRTGGRGSGAAGRTAAGSQTQSSGGNASGLQEVTTSDHLFHNKFSFLLKLKINYILSVLRRREYKIQRALTLSPCCSSGCSVTV